MAKKLTKRLMQLGGNQLLETGRVSATSFLYVQLFTSALCSGNVLCPYLLVIGSRFIPLETRSGLANIIVKQDLLTGDFA